MPILPAPNRFEQIGMRLRQIVSTDQAAVVTQHGIIGVDRRPHCLRIFVARANKLTLWRIVSRQHAALLKIESVEARGAHDIPIVLSGARFSEDALHQLRIASAVELRFDLWVQFFEPIDDAPRVGRSQRRIPRQLAFSLRFVLPFGCLGRCNRQTNDCRKNPREISTSFPHSTTPKKFRWL